MFGVICVTTDVYFDLGSQSDLELLTQSHLLDTSFTITNILQYMIEEGRAFIESIFMIT